MPEEQSKYKVLARKYRPDTLAELMGQDVLVKTLTNAIETGRLAHAYIFTGIRGVGKTSSARIFAKSLNCSGADGKAAGPQAKPCGVCENCRAIKEDRHMDVIEMDAASKTGVDDIREIIEGAQYKPTMARYKVYIIDEVHMLSKNAFNALLKTLEEPPPYVKFIFATTEIRKVPATILSRCQRFDLSRIEPDELARLFRKIALSEKIEISDDAIQIVAKVADGSARDGLSFMDQVIANAEGPIDAATVAKILGLAGKDAVLDLFEGLMSGKIAEAVGIVEAQYKAGADPALILTDLLETTHYVTRAKIAPGSSSALPLGAEQQKRIALWAGKLSIAVLARMWQMLLKGFDEMGRSPNALSAVEMLMIRIAYIGGQPTPAEMLANIETSTSGEVQKKNS
jgi:DNA polymerase-3 subunit gamma/tau